MKKQKYQTTEIGENNQRPDQKAEAKSIGLQLHRAMHVISAESPLLGVALRSPSPSKAAVVVMAKLMRRIRQIDKLKAKSDLIKRAGVKA